MRTNDSIKCLFHFPLLFFVAEYPLPGSGYFVCPQGGRRVVRKICVVVFALRRSVSVRVYRVEAFTVPQGGRLSRV